MTRRHASQTGTATHDAAVATPRATPPGEATQAMRSEARQRQLALESRYARAAMVASVIESVPLWTTVKDVSLRFQLVNQAYLQGTGRQATELIGKRRSEIDPPLPGDQAELIRMEADVLRHGRAMDLERFAVRLPDGRQRIRHVACAPLRDEGTEVLGVITWSEDVTDAVLVEDSRESNRELLRTVIEVVPHPLSFIGPDGTLLMVNPAWCRDMGLREEDAIGRRILDIESLPIDTRRKLWEANERLLAGGEVPLPMEMELPGPSGAPRHFVVSKASVHGAGGTLDGLVTVAVDVTRQLLAEQASRLAHQRLIDAMESLPAAFYLYDANERLIHANAVTAGYYPAEAAVTKPGLRYPELMRTGIRSEGLDARSTMQRYRRGLEYFRHPPDSFEQRLSDGRILLGRNRRTSDGGTISIRFDITDQKLIQGELEWRQKQMQDDLNLAADLQRSILQPVSPPDFLEVAWQLQSSSAVSGDLYDTRTDEQGAFQGFLGDATGHGIAAAFMTILVEAGLRAEASSVAPEDSLAELNRQLLQYRLDGRFVSGIRYRIAPDGTLALCNAGHPATILLSGAGGAPRLLNAGGLPLGWFESAPYTADHLRLQAGDSLVMYTDGLVERSDAEDRHFSEQALMEVAHRHRDREPADLVARLLAASDHHAGYAPANDDVTLFVLRYRGLAASSHIPH